MAKLTYSDQRLYYKVENFLLFTLVIANNLPFYFTLIIFVFVFIFLAIEGYFNDFMINWQKHLWPLLFFAYNFLTSSIGGNMPGFFLSLGLLVFYIYFDYYQKMINSIRFEEVVKYTLISSFFIFIFATFEYFDLIYEWNYDFLIPDDLEVRSIHWDRSEATFFNPNYYAMMLEFYILIGLYKLSKTSKVRKKWVYSLIIICNAIAIAYTGTRAVLPALFIGILTYAILARDKLILSFFATGFGAIIIAIFIRPELFSRLGDLAYAFSDRIEIWQTAWELFKENPLIGKGPLTYLNDYATINGREQIHAHNVILDALVSYGLVGLALIAKPLYHYGKSLYQLWKVPATRNYASLAVSIIVIIFTHGLFDLTIQWVQTLFLSSFILFANKQFINSDIANSINYYSQ